MRWVGDAAVGAEGINIVIRADQPFLREARLLPGALIEYLAQAAAAKIGDGSPARRLREGVLVAIKEFAIFRAVAAGDCLTLRVVPEKSFGPFTSAHLEARSDAGLVAKAEMTFHLTFE